MKKISVLVALVFLLAAGLFTLGRDCSYAEMAAMHEHHGEDGHHQHAHGGLPGKGVFIRFSAE